MYKVSVIIPVYNVEKYLERCLDSICNQTLKDIEIICINDCSPDNSLAILNEYATKDNRIKVIDFKENMGAAIARNKGLEIAKGEYLGFVDPDDYIDLNFYEELYKKAKEDKNADIVKGNLQTHFHGKIVTDTKVSQSINKNKFMFLYNWTSAIYNSSLLLDNKISFPCECSKAQDVVFLNRCVIRAKRVIICDEVSYHYVKRENSLDSFGFSNKSAYSALRACEIILQELNDAYVTRLIDADNYADLYGKRIQIVTHTYYFSNDFSVKKDCVLKIFESYHKCLEPSLMEKFFEYKMMFNEIKNGSYESLAAVLNKFPTEQQYCKAEVLFNLKQSLKEKKANK